MVNKDDYKENWPSPRRNGHSRCT